MARVQLDESWAAIREVWEHPAGRYSHSSGYASRDLYSPPRSRPQSSKQGTSNEANSDDGLLWSHTPLSEIFESSHFQNYKGIQQAVTTAAPDPSTPQNSSTPLFTERTPPGPNTAHNSRPKFFNPIKTTPHLEDAFMKEYRTMEHRTGKETLLGKSLPDHRLTEKENSFSSRKKRIRKPAPPSNGPFLAPSRIQYRRTLPDSGLRVVKDINLDLIRCCTLLASSDPDCLKFANNALKMSEDAGIYHLVTKSQLYRGLCLMELKRWKEASCTFTRAASVRDWEGKVWELKNLAESNLLQESRIGRKTKIGTVEEGSWDDHCR